MVDEKMSDLDPFYLIVDHVDWMERLVPLGVSLVQLRIKGENTGEVRRQAQIAKRICVENNCVLVLNDEWKIALDEGIDYIHLGQQDADEADMAAIANANIRFGLSTHSERELQRALSLRPNYIALGPVYKTILKKMTWSPQGLDRVREWKGLVGTTPLVGIGGLSVERAPGVLQAGADSVAVVTDVSLHADPEQRVKQWLQVTRPSS